jgi:farnesyl diphosphate synthase
MTNLYGTKAQNGKEGSDIQGNKCSWLIVEALKNCNSSQREILEANYGRGDQECAEKVKAIFEELDMSEAFRSYKKNTVTDIEALIESIDESSGLKKEVFSYYLSILVIV